VSEVVILLLSVALTLSCITAIEGAAPEVPDEKDVLKTLRQGHPRLIVLDPDVQRTKHAISTNPKLKEAFEALKRSGERMLTEPTVEYKLIGPRLLAQSRAALNRIYTLAALYRLEGDVKFAERARRELLAAANLPDWHPAHFLDTAEMCHAVAIGYDWLYHWLSPEDRQTLRKAIVEKGLRPSEPETASHNWWMKVRHNWNQVCHGGIAIGALAVAEDEPELAARIVRRAVAYVPFAMREYGPDGGWAEGPGYWGYATSYTVYFLAALETALGTDFGLSSLPGFRETGMFRLHFVGPTGLTFNYADAGDRAGSSTHMFWLAKRFQNPLYAWEAKQRMGADPLALFWYTESERGPKSTNTPLDAFFKGVNAVFMRSAWEDPRAVFVAFKGGDNKANHSHLDLGSFVLDALGKRWAVDLGPDDYDLPGYFGKQRWTYYRLRTEGHNTISVNGENQDPSADAPIIAFSSSNARAYGVADLTKAYPQKVERMWRGIALLNRTSVLIQDEVEAKYPIDLVWTMHTPAEISASGRTAQLKLGDEVLECNLLEPAGASFAVLPANPPPPERQQPEIKRLTIRVNNATRTRIVVLLTPRGLPSPPKVDVVPLLKWVDEAQFKMNQ
jgi:hypothetical protein